MDIDLICRSTTVKLAIVLLLVFSAACSTVVTRVDQDVNLAPRTAVQHLPDGSLLPLLLGELALRRGLLDVAARELTRAAQLTQHVDTAQRAAYVSRLAQDVASMRVSGELWSSLAPTDPLVSQHLALTLALQGEFKAAIHYLKQELEQGGGAGVVQVAGVSLTADKTQQNILISAYIDLLGQYPEQPEIAYGKALIHHSQGDLDATQTALNQVLAIATDYLPAQLLQVELLRQQHNTSAALNFLQHQLRSQQLPPKDLLVSYGQLLAETGQLKLALAVFEQLLHDNPYDTHLHYTAGSISLSLNLPHEAVNYFTTVLKHGYDGPNVHYFMGRSLLLLDQPAVATEHFVRVDGGSWLLPSQMELLHLYLQQEPDGSVDAFFAQRRLAFPQASAQLYHLEANFNLEQDNMTAASMVYDAGLSQYPDDIELLYGRAMLAARTDQLQRLETDLRHIIALQPDHAVALNALGYTLADRTDRLQEAQELIEKAYQLNPSDPATIDSLGWLQYKQGNYRRARDYLQQAFDRYPDAEVAAHLGIVLWALGDTRGAHQVWDQILQKDPDNILIKNAIIDAQHEFPAP